MTELSTSESHAGEALVGHVLGGAFRVDSQLGEGSMGRVYAARQLSIDRDVVVKVLKRSGRDAALDALLTKRFRREAQATARLSHSHTVRVIDYGETAEGLQYIVFERLVGESLDVIVAREGHLDPARVARVGAQIARSLDEAHAAGVVHRDLKPDNVFLCAYGDQRDVVKVMDFGVARLLPHTDQHVSQITRAGLTVGTPLYIAPEQARGLETTAATDLYSLGVMLFELLTGATPFNAATGMEVAIKHIREVPPELFIPRVTPEALGSWRFLVNRLLDKDPLRRPQSAAAVAVELDALAALSAQPAPQISDPALAVVAQVAPELAASLATTSGTDPAAAGSPAPTPAGAGAAAATRAPTPAPGSRAWLCLLGLALLALGVLLGRLIGP